MRGKPWPKQAEAEEGRVYTVTGQDWDQIVAAAYAAGVDPGRERLVINMGPQHPATHGVLRLILTLDGETVTELRVGIGYLHTGIEKNMEFCTWTQGVTFCTQMDYLAPLFNETVYCPASAVVASIRPSRLGVWAVAAARSCRVAGPACGVPAVTMISSSGAGSPVRGQAAFRRGERPSHNRCD